MSDVDARGALEAVDRILNRGGEPRTVLEEVLEALVERGVPYAAVRLAGGEEIAAGTPVPARSMQITRDGSNVGALVAAVDDCVLVARVAVLISPYVPRAG